MCRIVFQVQSSGICLSELAIKFDLEAPTVEDEKTIGKKQIDLFPCVS